MPILALRRGLVHFSAKEHLWLTAVRRKHGPVPFGCVQLAGSRSEADRHVSHGINSNDQGIDGVRDSRKRISTAVALGGAATALFRRNQVGPPAPVLCVACMTASGLTTQSVRRFRQAATPWKGARWGERVFLCPNCKTNPLPRELRLLRPRCRPRDPIGLRVTARIPTKIAKECTDVKQLFQAIGSWIRA